VIEHGDLRFSSGLVRPELTSGQVMPRYSVEVKPDFLQKLASVTPIQAVSELIWNGLDADANTVRVEIVKNDLDAVRTVRVKDDGHGLPASRAEEAFRNLGGSTKRSSRWTPGGRLFHGAQGRGRFRAFALGERVIWTSRYRDNGGVQEFTIEGSHSQSGVFEASEPRPATDAAGMTVETFDPPREPESLEPSRAVPNLTEEFAPYLKLYPGVRIFYGGDRIDPRAVQEHIAEIELPPVDVGEGKQASAHLTIVEWKISTGRSLCLCDENGFTLQHLKPGIHAPGFENFTAYLKSSYIRELDESNSLVLEEFDPGLNKLLDTAKSKLREHFRARQAERVRELVAKWKQDDVYPYAGDPQTSVERVERQAFEVVALNVNAYAPNFEASDVRSKRLAFRLLRQAIELSPTAVQKILGDVLDLPEERQEELARLLEKTPLDRIIRASKVVTDRLNFLAGLETLLFDEPHRSALLEKAHLHRILEGETWIFGEEFNLTTSETSLTNVLRQHLAGLEIELADDAPVVRENGTEGRLDLMLARAVPTPRPQHMEFLGYLE
jgi:hypothetical protein